MLSRHNKTPPKVFDKNFRGRFIHPVPFRLLPIFLFEYKQRSHILSENRRHLECQQSGRHIFSGFDSIDRLPTHLYPFRQFLLSHTTYDPLYFQAIFHLRSLF